MIVFPEIRDMSTARIMTSLQIIADAVFNDRLDPMTARDSMRLIKDELLIREGVSGPCGMDQETAAHAYLIEALVIEHYDMTWEEFYV